jgi:hypothetical protein
MFPELTKNRTGGHPSKEDPVEKRLHSFSSILKNEVELMRPKECGSS